MEDGRRTRNAERTRAAILLAATELMASRGLNVSLGDIAAHAGVTKGGVTHHFASREELVVAALRSALDGFRGAVERHLDITENKPGKMTRAYVRALCGGSPEAMQFFASFASWNSVSGTPALDEIVHEDSVWWTNTFDADGLHPERVLVVTSTAENIAMTFFHGAPDPARMEWVRSVLLDLTLSDGPLTSDRRIGDYTRAIT